MLLDVFSQDIFSFLSLTTSIDKLPYNPQRIGQLGVFAERGINTTSAIVEERNGKLQILSTAPRGTMGQVGSGVKRKAKAFLVPSIPMNEEVLADDVQGVRAFGSETETETVAGKVAEKLMLMKNSFEATKEWHRIGALQGITYDADGSTVIYNWFTEFGITPRTYQVDFTYTSGNDLVPQLPSSGVKIVAALIKRAVQDSLGATPFTGLRALCGSQFYDALIQSQEVRAAYNRQRDNEFAITQQARMVGGFMYADIIWEEYRGWNGSSPQLDPAKAVVYPEGTSGVFECVYAPAPFIETVNTVGRPYYVKQELKKFGLGVDLHGQSNPLYMCTRPAVLTELTFTGYSGS